MNTRWNNGHRKLTANQESVFRTIFDEELQAGESPASALREAERFMNEDALPDWQQFWRDWNAPPGPLERLIELYAEMAMITAIAQNADKFSEQLREMVRPLSYIVDEIKGKK